MIKQNKIAEKKNTANWLLLSDLIAGVSKVVKRMETEESEPFHSFYAKYDVTWMLRQFKEDKDNGKERKTWNVIPTEQYRTLLERFMYEPQMARIPDNVVTEWIMTIFRNFCQIVSITKLYGKTNEFPIREVAEAFPDVPNSHDTASWIIFLKSIGFYEWSNVFGRMAFSDYGLEPLFNILKTYNEKMTPEEKLILVNRCLDVTHKRGSMAIWFIEGGKETCDRISRKHERIKKRGI